MEIAVDFLEDNKVDLRPYGTWLIWKQDHRNGKIFDVRLCEGNIDYIALRLGEDERNISYFKKVKILKQEDLKTDPSDYVLLHLVDVDSEESTEEFQSGMLSRSCFVNTERISNHVFKISRKLSAREQVEKNYNDLLNRLNEENRKMLEEITDYWRRNGIEAKTRTSVS